MRHCRTLSSACGSYERHTICYTIMQARDFKDIYVVFELMETDLHQVGLGAVPC